MNTRHTIFTFLTASAGLSLVHAGTVTVSADPPVIDRADIAQLSGSSDAGGDQGHLWSNRPHQGQSFVTGADPDGYFLTSITLQNLNNTIATSPTFNLQVGTLSETGSPESFVQIGPTSTAVAPSYAPLDYLTFTFAVPIRLNPGTRYAFLWGTSSQGFVTVNNLDDTSYSDGTAISSGSANTPDPANVILRNVDRVFHLNLEQVASFDQDEDGLPSQWEIDHNLDPNDNGETPNNNGVPGDPVNGPNGDPDMDGLVNMDELERGSKPRDPDSDDDTLSDLVETKTGIFIDATDTGSDPMRKDTDGDTIEDQVEIEANPYFTDPNKTDTDGDGLSDFDELQADPFVTIPSVADSDNDGFHDGQEITGESDPTDPLSLPDLGPMFVSNLPPTFNSVDIAQLGGTEDIGGDPGHSWSNRPRQGQSFTTGDNAGGYILDRITVRALLNRGSTIAPSWAIRVGSIDESGVFSPLVTETITGVTIPDGNENWVTWVLSTPLQLESNTKYGYDIYPDGSGFIGLGESGDALPNGSAFSSGSPGSTIYPDSPPNPVTSHSGDRAFHLNLEAVGGGDLEFTEIHLVQTPDGEEVRLTWKSIPGNSYAVDASVNLVTWADEVANTISADADTTTIQVPLTDLPVSGLRVFFRVRLEE